VLSIAVLLPLVAGRLVPLLVRQRVLAWALVGFVLLPPIAAINFPNGGFIVGVVGPYMIGGVSLLCLAALREGAFQRWSEGVGFVALAFVLAGLARYGLEATSYYGRPRVHLGFSHPIQSSSALLVAAFYLARVTGKLPDRLGWLRRAARVAILVGSSILLVLVQSRNAFLLFCVIFLAAGYARVFRAPRARLALVVAILALFPAIMTFAYQVSREDPLWILLDFASSYRLTFYANTLADFLRGDWATMLFGPASIVRTRSEGAQGFAVADSVYLSILLNYGVVTLLSFYAFWLAVARRVARAPGTLAFGLLCGVSTYYLLDAQGVTPSNLLVFVLLARTARTAIAARAVPPPAGAEPVPTRPGGR